MDVVLAAGLLVLTSPLLAVVALVIRSTMGKPILFRQERIGHGGQLFTLYKFRTMKDSASSDGQPLPDEKRLTTVGRFVRSISLDELPELMNVLKGDMSVVGPRPLLVEYRERYSPRQWRRHEMPPGLVGPVTAYGRNALGWDDKFELDVWYVDNWSLLLDMKLMLRSAWNALKRQGITAENHVTMPRFEGSRKDKDA
jgi:lipopolysaccharide/colanic/teichoic acid biosynthesis glycosyltransferase